MNPQRRQDLTRELSVLTGRIAADLQKKILAPGAAQERARQLHADEKVGENFEVWTDLLSRRAAVLWVLKSVYVRVFEDRGLLKPGRILDPESKHLFEHLAPALGDTAYLRWVYEDLAMPKGGLPELFSPQPAEVSEPSDALSQELIQFWRQTDVDSGELRYRFDDEHFDGRLMGDLYQDLDPVVKARYALLQTPDFVLDFILDQTLTPALKEWDVEAIRVLDPACGSGHFLLAAFKRLVAAMRVKFPKRPIRAVVEHCLARVVGVDLNDYACGLARARLLMTALELAAEESLAAGGDVHPQVFWADGLEQIEADEQLEMLKVGQGKPRAALTRPEVREALRPILKARFHVVVGNPPYITEKDPKQREYHREKVGKDRRYISAAGKYSLGAPFTERMFQLSVEGGFVGEITSNSFLKREFGKALIEKVLSREELFKIVDTSGAFIPGHGTPTVLVFGRHKRPEPGNPTVLVVMGKRGEPGRPAEPAKGRVWSSIIEGHSSEGFENEFLSVARMSRAALAGHPWSIGGGGAAELKTQLEANAKRRLGQLAQSIGIVSFTLEDEVYIRPSATWARIGVPPKSLRAMVVGDELRDWVAQPPQFAFFPYDGDFKPLPEADASFQALWPFRTGLGANILFGGQTKLEAGLRWFEYGRLTATKLETPLSITFGEVATHNHFLLDRGGKVFKQTAPVIKLPKDASEEEHFVLLAQLNSSTACFWLKQVCHDKGLGGRGMAGVNPEEWERFFQFNGTALLKFPVGCVDDDRVLEFSTRLDRLAADRQKRSAGSIVALSAKEGAVRLRHALLQRRRSDTEDLAALVALQEELDWLCYDIYAIEKGAKIRSAHQLDPCLPGCRPFEILEAIRLEGEAKSPEMEEKTDWFARHGWERHTSVSELPAANQKSVQDRLNLIEGNRSLALIEKPAFKRRWYRPDYEAEERAALEEFLSDRIEDWAKQKPEPFTIQKAVAALQNEPDVLAGAELLSGTATFDLEALFRERVLADAVPNNKHHVFKPTGLAKRKAWEHTWEMQRREDAGERVVPPVPPRYTSADYQRGEYWSHRGALDVPKERYIALTEIPGAGGPDALFTWTGLTPRQRAKLLLELDEKMEDQGLALEARTGLLYGAQFQLPYVAWESESAALEFKAIITGLVGKDGITEKMLEEWASAHAPVRGAARRGAKGTKKAAKPKETGEEAAG